MTCYKCNRRAGLLEARAKALAVIRVMDDQKKDGRLCAHNCGE